MTLVRFDADQGRFWENHNGLVRLTLAFAKSVVTGTPGSSGDTGVAHLAMLPNARINPLFAATIQATEEAIVNALLAADTMVGANDARVYALPRDRLLAALKKYGRGVPSQ